MTESTAASQVYRAARDHLVAHREDYDAVVSAFQLAGCRVTGSTGRSTGSTTSRRGNPRTALRIIGDDGADESYSFAEMAQRSDRLATWLADGGVAPGDRVMLMLGNQVELWESMLAVMKLGAVILPATTALGPKDLADRLARGGRRARHHQRLRRPRSSPTSPGDYGRIAIGDAPAPWRSYRDCERRHRRQRRSPRRPRRTTRC